MTKEVPFQDTPPLLLCTQCCSVNIVAPEKPLSTMFLFIPIFFGCQTKLKPDTHQMPRICPRCHNACVFPAKKTTWFELFFIPVVPLSRKHILMCTICGWQAAIIDYEQAPTSSGAGSRSIPQLRSAQGWEAPNQPGYQPAYISQSQNQKK